MFVFLLLVQKSENCALLNEVKALKFSLVTRTSYLSASPSRPSHPFFCVMTSSPSLFWKVVSPLWPHLTPQQPEVVNTLSYPSLPRSCTVSSLSLSILLSSLLFPRCHCGRELQPTLIAPSLKGPSLQLGRPHRAYSKTCFAFSPHTAVLALLASTRDLLHVWMKRLLSRVSLLTTPVLHHIVSLVS